MRHLVFLGISLLLTPAVSAAENVTCYKPDGISRSNDGTKLCNGIEGAVSMCCGSDDTCLQNGLCKVEGDVSYWRDMCSVSNWPEEGCLRNICTDDSEIDDNGDAQMTPCDGTDYSETWCCGQSDDCCDTDDAITIPSNIYTSATSSVTSTTPIATTTSSSSPTSTTTTTTSAASPKPTSEKHASSSLSTGAKAGIGVGVAAGVIIGAGLLFFFLRRRKSQDTYEPAVTQSPRELQPNPVYEKPADAQSARYELPGPEGSSTALESYK